MSYNLDSNDVTCDHFGCINSAHCFSRRGTSGWGAGRRRYTYIESAGWWYSHSGGSGMFHQGQPHWNWPERTGVFLCPEHAATRKNRGVLTAIRTAKALLV